MRNGNHDIGLKVDRLADEWGYFEISVRPHSANRVRVRNHTDEGLSADKRLWTEGETVGEALDHALNGNAVSSYTEDAPWRDESDR